MKGIFTTLVVGLLLLSPDLTIAEEVPVEHFSRLPKFSRPSLSPDGKSVAYIENHQKQGLSLLMAINHQQRKPKFLVKSDNEEARINWFTWANNRTIVVSVRYASKRNGTDTTETRLFAVDMVDDPEAEPRLLINPRYRNHYSQFQDDIIDFLPDDEDHVLIALDADTQNLPSVYRLNIYTKKLSRVEKGKRKVRSWLTDQQSQLRLGKSLDYKRGTAKIIVRKSEDDDWETLYEYNALEEPGVSALGFDLDPNILYLSKYKGDMKALYKVDLTSKEETLVFEDPDHDVDGRLLYSNKNRDVIGITHLNSHDGRVFWDKGRENFKKALDTALPDTDNYLTDFNQDETVYILYAENDTTPGMYLLGDRQAGTLELLFHQYPEIEPTTLSEHKLISYTARDGVEIEGYLTLPQNTEGPVPTILHPHGGPGARDVDGFDYWTSFFSSRGYAVFRPNFRGSTGYGYEFANSQMQGWGLTMQDDLTDATKWLISEKVADPERICIVGASYGGYAASMAAVKTPELFKCAVSFAGVMDLRKIVSRSRRYTNSKFVKKQFGTDSDDLEARSPYYQAEKVKIPMLIAHGEVDRVVDVEQSRDFVEELQDYEKDVQYIEFKNGDHYLSIQRNRHEFFSALDAFLKEHLE